MFRTFGYKYADIVCNIIQLTLPTYAMPVYLLYNNLSKTKPQQKGHFTGNDIKYSTIVSLVLSVLRRDE